MSKSDIWNKYIKKSIIGSGLFSIVYKAINIKTEDYVAIKEINKLKYNEFTKTNFEQNEIIKINSENSISIIETFDTQDNFYIIMELSLCNLEDYLKIRKNPLTIIEIQNFLIQINNVFKIMLEKKIIHKNLKPSNILLSFDSLNNLKFVLSDFGLNNLTNNLNTILIKEVSSLISPEVLNNEPISLKSNLWSLGIIVYYLLFKEYPFNINSKLGKYKIIPQNKLKQIDDKDLNELIQQMLLVNENERISWNNYFNHQFFKKNLKQQIKQIKEPSFDFKCKIHNQFIISYCIDCKKNICKICINQQHESHDFVYFSEIGLNELELKKIKYLMNELEKNINIFNENAKNIQNIINQIKLIKSNSSIFDNDLNNNYKLYYIENLKLLNEKIKFNEKINLIDLNSKKENDYKDENNYTNENNYKEENNNFIENNINKNLIKNGSERNNNYIICKYEIKENKLNKPIQILNSYENVIKKNSWYQNKGNENDKEIKDNCELYLDGNKISFTYQYIFKKQGKYTIKMVFKKPLTNINYMFCWCSCLISIDLSNFDSNNVIFMNNMFNFCNSLKFINLSNFNTINTVNMEYLFSSCSSIETLDLTYFNTYNVINMSNMFSNCSSLHTIYLSSFDTSNVIDMSGMFNGCSSILFLDISNFDTKNVIDMNAMFLKCSSLRKIDLLNFKTNNVTNMRKMFEQCNSLSTLNLINFDTSKVKDMEHMFSNCSSLTNIDLTNFNTENVTDMNNMFSKCSSIKLIDLSSFNTKNVVNMKEMFSKCSSLKTLNLSSFNTIKVKDMSFMFSYCFSLASLILYSFDTQNVKLIEGMFSNCTCIMTLDLSNFNTINVENMSYLFYNCKSLMTINLLNFNTLKVNNMNNMFSNCSSLTSLNLSCFNTNNVTDMYHMFYNCSSLMFLNLANFNVNKTNDINGIFHNLNKNCKIIARQKKLLNLLNK